MFSIIWNLIKSLRYLLPFLNEVTDERDADISKDDLYRIEQLKKLLSLAIWRIIYLVILVSVVYWGVIPLYTENAVLKQEINDRDRRIIQLTDDVNKIRNDARRTTESLITYPADLKSVTEENRRLANVINECRTNEAQYRNFFLEKNGKLPSTIKTTAGTDSTEKKKKSVTDNVKAKLNALK